MGNNRLGRLPKTDNWQRVVKLLDAGGDISAIAVSSLEAVQNGLKVASSDPAFVQTLIGIFDFLDCAASKDLVRSMQERGYDVTADASLFDIVDGLKSKIDADVQSLRSRSDLGELTQNAFTEVLLKHASAGSKSLFEVTTETAQQNLSKSVRGTGLKTLMHEFFASFTSRYLSYYLSRELSNHVGRTQRFESVESHREFSKAFDLYVRQSVSIADEFTPGWFGKARFNKTLDRESVGHYAHVALKKISSEFAKGGGTDQ
jgi:hypothetical protein